MYLKAVRVTIFTLILLPFFVMADIELRILCWEGYAPTERVRQFEQYISEKYHEILTVNVKYATEDKELFDAIRAKKADIISPVHSIPKSISWPMIQYNFVLPLNLQNIPNYKNLNSQLILKDFITDNQQTYAVPLLYGAYGLAYNKEKVLEKPLSLSIFWQPEYKGKYAVSDVFYEENIYLTALALGYPAAQLTDYNAFSKDKQFRLKLAQLAQNAGELWLGVDTAADLKGLSISTSFGFSFMDLKQQGENWAFAFPQEGQSAWVDHWAIGYSLKDDPLKKQIAEEWINFTLNDDMQLELARQLNSFPVIQNFTQKLSAEEISKYHLDTPNFFNEKFFLLKFLDRRQKNGFKNLWQQAKSAKLAK